VAARRSILLVAGLLAAAGGAVVIAQGSGAPSAVTSAPDEVDVPAPPSEEPPPPPTLVSGASDARARAERARQRALDDWESARRLFADGKAGDALAVVAELRKAAPGFLDDPARAKEVARMEAAVRAAKASERLLAASANLRLTAEQRAAFERRLAATTGVLAGSLDEGDLDALTRHVSRFLVPEGAAPVTPDAKDWVGTALSRLVQDRRGRRAKDENPGLADAAEAERRRLEQLEKLRQRDAVGILDHVHAGLAWLAIHQRDDGAFCDAATADRCKTLKHEPACLAKWPNAGDAYAIATTGLACLAFLDFRDQDPNGWFDPYLGRGLAWLLKQQKADGSFPGTGQLYTTAIALMALGQAAGSTGQQPYRDAVTKGLTFLLAAPGPFGNWRYGPRDQKGDTSVTAWVAQSFEAARGAGIEVPRAAWEHLDTFLRYFWIGDHRFSYEYGRGESGSLYPAGMLIGHIVGKTKDTAVADEWRAFLKSRPVDKKPDLYTLYYGVRISILLSNALEGPWRTWTMALADRQVKGESAAGMFPGDLWNRPGGATLQTAVAVLTLEHALYLR
jgi:hypothetical protein